MSSILCKLILQVTAKGWACAGGLWLEYRQACILYLFSTFPSSPRKITHEGQVAWAGAEWGWFALREGSKSPGSSSTAASPPSGIRIKEDCGRSHLDEGDAIGKKAWGRGIVHLVFLHWHWHTCNHNCFTNHISQNPSEQSSGSEILYPTHLK